MSRIITLDEFIIDRQKDFPFATGELTGLLRDIGIATKVISREVNKAGLIDIFGEAGQGNASGDEVQKLDVMSNDMMVQFLRNSGECCGIASEEEDDFVAFQNKAGKSAKYVVVFDPLDGSSNIDANVPIGTIFGIYRRLSEEGEITELKDFLQKGSEQVAAGYVMYGSSTILAYTTGNGVNIFTLDTSIGEYCLSHKNLKMPETGKIYSVNQGYYIKFDLEMRRYIDYCNDKAHKLRYIGTMVADIHRTLIKGGIFIYPAMIGYPNGKLRLLYECNPLSFLIEQAGGKSISGNLKRVMDIPLSKLHQTSSIIMGSSEMVDNFEKFVAKYGASSFS
ncbi:MAG: fructose-1,6-bisphosphatase I [Cognaticolwellia sp.]|jgi:fructose-1,6-bisphosphatase I